MAITLAQAKSLCTASELALVSASTRNEIGKLSAAQLRLKISRTRKTRDKWRDQAEGQRRATQTAQRGRQTGANARSAEKAELFGEVLGRFETQLAKLEAKGATGGAAPKRLPRRARSATHRATRAVVRDALKESRLELGGRKKPAKSKAAKSKSARTKATQSKAAAAPPAVTEPPAEETPAHVEGAPKPTIPGKKGGKGKMAAAGVGMSAIESARAVQGLRVTKGKQRSATTAAKQDRLKAAGVIRMQMHASSRGRRRQGKRDSW